VAVEISYEGTYCVDAARATPACSTSISAPWGTWVASTLVRLAIPLDFLPADADNAYTRSGFTAP